MIEKNVKIAITGAAGQIGYALLFRIASGEMFGLQTKVTLSLLELPQAMEAARGVVMELKDCAFPLLAGIEVSDDAEVAFKDVDWALLVGSVPRKKGMERNDLIQINSQIFVKQGKALSMSAKKGCKVLVVGNPCNTNAYIAKESAPRLSPKNFFALTLLDQNRAVAQIAEKAGVSVSEIKNLAIWGNHSSTQYPDFYYATIQGRPLRDIISDEDWLKTTFIQTVQQRGAAIIQARGLSSAASAANAVIDTVKKIVTPTKEGEFFSLAVCSDGSYGVEEGLIFSYPVKSDGGHWEIVQNIKQNDYAKKKISETIKELLLEKQIVSPLLDV